MGISLMIELPEELVMEILSKLPVKSLLRFSCVSKHWASTFRTSHFITKHYLNNNNLDKDNLNLLLNRTHGGTNDPSAITYFSALSTKNNNNNLGNSEEDIELPFFEDLLFPPSIDGPCNGLLCLNDRCWGAIALWNPSTREFKVVPKSTVQRPFSEFDPDPAAVSTRFGAVGFGYDSTAHDYKIVRFVNNWLDDQQGRYPLLNVDQFELYSLQTDSWKEIIPPDPHGGLVLPWLGIGMPLLFNNYYYYYWEEGHLIVSFDFAKEKFSTFPFPPTPQRQLETVGGYMDLLGFNGLLGAIYYPSEPVDQRYFDLWVLNTHNHNNMSSHEGSWTKQCRIEPIPGIGIERPLGFWQNGQKIFLETSTHQLVLFDPATKEIKNLGIDATKGTMHLIAYAQSLVPINGRSEQEEHIVHHPPGHLRHQYQLVIENKEKKAS